MKGCPTKHYGLESKSKCVGHCKDNTACNHTSGLCDIGCEDGWTGGNCTEGEIFLYKDSHLMDILYRIN